MTIAQPVTTASDAPHGLSFKDFRERLNLSHSGAYKALKRGDFRVIKVGRRTIVPASELARILAGKNTPTN